MESLVGPLGDFQSHGAENIWSESKAMLEHEESVAYNYRTQCRFEFDLKGGDE